jgi:hypothetical protein
MSNDSAREWRDLFQTLFQREMESLRESLNRIEEKVDKQNDRIRKNEAAIAQLKTWVALVGSGMGLLGLAAAIFEILSR